MIRCVCVCVCVHCLLPLALLLVLRTRNNTDGNKLVIFSGIALYYGDTVKPPNKGHIGGGSVVPCREVVLFSEVFFYTYWKFFKDKNNS